jgi:hypothetical protein
MGDVEAKFSRSLKRGGRKPPPVGPTLADNTAPGNSPEREDDRGQRPPPRKRAVVDHGDLDMRIARDGTWFYRGSPIARQPLVKLFATVLRREGDGSYWLVTPAERGRVDVEDAPFLAVEVTSEGQGRQRRLSFRTNLDQIVAAGPEHGLRVDTAANGEPAPYILVRPGLEARINRPVFYELVELADAERGERGGRFGLWSDGAFFDLGDPEGA